LGFFAALAESVPTIKTIQILNIKLLILQFLIFSDHESREFHELIFQPSLLLFARFVRFVIKPSIFLLL